MFTGFGSRRKARVIDRSEKLGRIADVVFMTAMKARELSAVPEASREALLAERLDDIAMEYRTLARTGASVIKL